MMKIKTYLLTASVLLFFACGNFKKTEVKSLKKNSSTEYITASGKKFVVHITHPNGASICNVQIETVGFSASNTTYELGDTDPVEMVFLADLDQNGYEEIYLVTRSAGSGSYANIYGFASNKDKSATPVYVRPITENQLSEGNLFQGFRGHNRFSVEEGRLTNTFPVYLDTDNNSQASGGKRTISYRLIAGEAGWILEPVQKL